MGRPTGALNGANRLFQKKVRDIISDEDYVAVIHSLIDIALHSKAPNARVAAAKIIIDRVEGNLPQAIITNEQVTLESVLNDFRTRNNTE